MYIFIFTCSVKWVIMKHLSQNEHATAHRVVEAWAMMLPPMGFLGSAENMAAPSTCATTWLVITTATPNCDRKDKYQNRKRKFYNVQSRVKMEIILINLFGHECH